MPRAKKKIPGTSKKPKIPNVCKQFGVEYVGPYEMLRQLGAKFKM